METKPFNLEAMKIESTTVQVNAAQTDVLTFLQDARNFSHLLPQDKITDWKATEEQCSFKVQGGITITLVQNGTADNDKVLMKSGEKSPFPFNLIIHVNPNGESTEGYITFDGEVNMFLKMMVEKPLTNLFNYMSNKLMEYYQ